MKKILIVIFLLSHMPLSAYEMEIKSGWQLLGAVEPINMLTIFEERCVNSIFTYKNNEWSEYSFRNGKYSVYDINIIDTINKGEGFWINGASDDNCSVNLFEEIEPILVVRDTRSGLLSYSGQNIITSKESFQSLIDEFKNVPGYGNSWSSVLEKSNINFEKNNIFLNILYQTSICQYQTAINLNNDIFSIDTNHIYTDYVYTLDSGYETFYCADSSVNYLMVFRISKQIKTFDVKSFRDEKITIENK